MRRILLVIFALAFASGAQAQNYTATAGSGLTFGAKLGSGSVLFPYFIGCDATTPTQCWSVNSSGQLSITVASLPLPSGAATSANQSTEITSLGTIATNSGTQATATNQTTINTSIGTTNTQIGAGSTSPCASPTTSCNLNQLLQLIAQTAAAPGALSSQYPSGATPLTASATGTTAATTATLAGTTGKTTYICGYSIRANATANTNVTNTLTGVITGTMSSIMWVPANTAGLGVDEQIFSPCIPASAQNTAIAAVSGAPGTGGLVSVKAWGYQQ